MRLNCRLLRLPCWNDIASCSGTGTPSSILRGTPTTKSSSPAIWFDSLAIAGFLASKEKVLDVGTGGGVPGVVLAIVRDDLHVSLSESVGKKARAVADIVEQLALPVPVLHARAEDILAGQRFDTLVVRAVARLKKLLEWFRPHWGAFDRLLVLKGPSWVEERGEARHYGLMHDLALRKLATYPLPGAQSESVLLQIRRR